MISCTGNTALAFEFEFANEVEITDLGLVGYAILSSRNARDAQNLWISYGRSLFGMLVQIRVEEREDCWQMYFFTEVPVGDAVVFSSEEFLLFNLLLCETLLGQPLKTRMLELAYPKPAHHALYETYFKCPVIFDAPHTRLTATEPRLDHPVKTNNEEHRAVCLAHCDQIMRQITQSSPLVHCYWRHQDVFQGCRKLPASSTAARAA